MKNSDNISKKRKRKKPRIDYFKFFRGMLIILSVLGLSVMLIYSVASGLKRPYSLEYEKLDIEKEYDSVIFRKEYVARTYTSGSVKFYSKEGEKVQNGERIMTQTSSADYSPLNMSQKKPDSQYVKAETPVPQWKIKYEIESLTNTIAFAIREKRYKDVENLRKQLDVKIAALKKSDSAVNKVEFGDTSYREITFGGSGYNKGQVIDLYSPSTGYLTFNLDGFESALTLDNLYNIDYDKLGQGQAKNVSSSFYSAGSPVFKLIDDSVWYTVMTMPKEDMDLFEIDKDIIVSMDGDDLSGKVIDIFDTVNGKGAILVKISDFSNTLYGKRFVKAKIKIDDYQGIRLYQDSVVEQDGVKGVYVLDIGKNLEFTPVRALGNNDEKGTVVVKEGYINTFKGGKLVRFKSLDLGDKVLRNGYKWK